MNRRDALLRAQGRVSIIASLRHSRMAAARETERLWRRLGVTFVRIGPRRDGGRGIEATRVYPDGREEPVNLESESRIEYLRYEPC